MRKIIVLRKKGIFSIILAQTIDRMCKIILECKRKKEVRKMCKYAKNDIFKVSTQKQVQIIAEVLKSKGSSSPASKSTPKFNAHLWKKNTNVTNPISNG